MKRVGITTDIDERKAYWSREYPNLRNWQIVEIGLTYDQAQKIENDYIKRGYKGHAGGERKAGSQYKVYTFKC